MGRGGPELRVHAVGIKMQQNGTLEAKIYDRYFKPAFRLGQGLPDKRQAHIGGGRKHAAFPGRGFGGQIQPLHGGQGPGPAQQRRAIQVQSADNAVARALFAQMQGQGAGIQPADAGKSAFTHASVQGALGPPVRKGAVFSACEEVMKDSAFGLKAGGFVIAGADSVVAQMRGGKDNDLAVKGRVCQSFLVAAHAGGKDHLTGGLLRRAAGQPLKTGSIVQH